MTAYTQALAWRYSSKKFSGKALPTDTLQRILDAARLSASSLGLQPYRLVVVSNPEQKKALSPALYGQAQAETASELIFLCTELNINQNLIDRYFDRIHTARQSSAEQTQGFKNMVEGFVHNMTDEARQTWAQKQCYLALGTMLLACAEEQIDACPMEGFNPQAVSDILKLDEQHLSPCVLLAVGYRAEDDGLQHAPKVRASIEEMVINL
jgi:nitroreductase